MQKVIFVCEHGAAKSIIAAAHFNRLAEQYGFDLRATARGTNPDAELALKAVQGLAADGLESTEKSPIKLSMDDLKSAHQVVRFCELPEEYQAISRAEHWDDVPPVSEGYEKARDAILRHLEQLLQNMQRTS